MGNNVANVTVGKPKVTGAIYRAVIGTVPPTDAVSDLAAAFAALGYVSEDGVTNANTREVDDFKAWGGDTVLSVQTGKDDKFTFRLVEALSDEVLKAVSGSANVSGALSTGLTVNVNATELEEAVWVIDMLLKGNAVKRIVIPRGKVTEIGDVEYKDDTPIGYDVTISCLPDSAGNTHYEYLQATPAGTVTLNKTTASVAAGSTTSITATTVPSGGTVKWSSSDTDIATVTGGTVTGVAAGSCTITARVPATGAEATCALTVTS